MVYLPTFSESNARGFRLFITGISEYFWWFPTDFQTLPKMSKDVPATFEHFQSYFKGGISVCWDKVKCLYETFLGKFNLIFVINHVLKNITSSFVS